MTDTPETPESRGDRPGRENGQVRAAARFTLLVTAAAVGFLLLASLWVRGCGTPDGVETVACGTPYRLLLVLGSPGILAVGGLAAFVRTYHVWRVRGTWWGWQGAGWFLLVMMLFVLTVSAGPIAGPPDGE